MKNCQMFEFYEDSFIVKQNKKFLSWNHWNQGKKNSCPEWIRWLSFDFLFFFFVRFYYFDNDDAHTYAHNRRKMMANSQDKLFRKKNSKKKFECHPYTQATLFDNLTFYSFHSIDSNFFFCHLGASKIKLLFV